MTTSQQAAGNAQRLNVDLEVLRQQLAFVQQGIADSEVGVTSLCSDTGHFLVVSLYTKTVRTMIMIRCAMDVQVDRVAPTASLGSDPGVIVLTMHANSSSTNRCKDRSNRLHPFGHSHQDKANSQLC